MVMHWSTALLYKTARALHLSSTGLQIAMHTWGELVVLCTILTTTFVTDGTKPVLCGTSICGHEASCNGICVCKKGYTGKIIPRYPTPVVWCQKKCAGNEQICPLNTTCLTHTSGPASCECSQGFLMDTFGQCLDADECSDNPGICGNHSTCTNTVGNYTCRCHEGYVDVDGTGRFCEKDFR
ncbi:adhesion G protein-coupled receptor E1-like [Liolophura sinensis]|uniref:adhesion G protein-coupled receptor E1-like n=1 Tax=Liolophura sinensis TaxID=3198878 RepID=UPI003158981C